MNQKALTRGRTDHFSNTFPPVTVNFLPMTLTIELDIDSNKVNQNAKYPGRRSYRSKVIIHIRRHRCTKTNRGWIVLAPVMNMRVTTVI